MKFLIFLLLTRSYLSFIAQINPIGDIPWIYGNLTLTGGESECVPFLAEGSIHSLAMRYYYSSFKEILALNTDLLFSIAITTPLWEIKECISIGGYNKQYQYCKHDSYWNTSFWRSTNDGGVEGYVDFLPYKLRNEDQYWLFCVTNGWQGSATKVHYQVSVVFVNSDISVTGYAPGLSPTRSPTSSPTPVDNPVPTPVPTMTAMPTIPYPNQDTQQYLKIQSGLSCPNITKSNNIEIIYHIQLASQQETCLHVPTSRPIVNMTLTLSKLSVSDNVYSSISDLSISIVELISSSAIQIGGEYILSDPDNIKVTLEWPQNWENLDVYNSLTTKMSLPSLSYSSHNWNNNYFSYKICLVNTYLNSSLSPTSTAYSYLPNNKIWYEGSILLSDTSVSCYIDSRTETPTVAPTIAPTLSLSQRISEISKENEILTVTVDSTMLGGDSICLDVEISGALYNISLDLFYTGNDISWLSDLLISIRTPSKQSQNTSQCSQFGGVSSNICYEDCDWSGLWPDSLNVVSSGHYVLTAIATNGPRYEYGIRQLCITHANYPSNIVTYLGTLSLNGLYHSSRPTPRIQSEGTTTTSSTIFLVFLIVPLAACFCLCLVTYIYSQRQKLIFYHQTVGNEEIVLEQDIYSLPEHPSQDVVVYSEQVVDPDFISLQEEESLFTSQGPTIADVLPISKSASSSSTASNTTSSFMRLPSFSLPMTAAEKEKQKGSLQFTAPKQYTTPTSASPVLLVSASSFTDEKSDRQPSSRQSSFNSRNSSSSASSSPSVQSKKSILSLPKSLLSQSAKPESLGTGTLMDQRRQVQRPQISNLFEGDIFAEDYSSHSFGDRDIELTDSHLYQEDSNIDRQAMTSSVPFGQLASSELQISLTDTDDDEEVMAPRDLAVLDQGISRSTLRASSGSSSTGRPSLTHQSARESTQTASSHNSIIDGETIILDDWLSK